MQHLSPFSNSEKNSIIKLLENIGFTPKLTIENLHRYSIIKDKYIVIVSKYSVSLNFKLNIPFEIIAFQHSFLMNPKVINDTTLEIINFIATNLKYIAENLKLEHILPIEEKKADFLNALNAFLPENFNADNERQWLSRIRISYLNKNEFFKDVNDEFYDNLSKSISSIGLEPSIDLPVCLSNGIPKFKKDLVLFYKNPIENEYFIIEPGFFTFLRDFEQNNIILRSFFETYTPLLFHKIFKDIEGFSIYNFILDWIKFSRICLNPHINVLNSEYILSREFYPINLISFFKTIDNFSEIAFPIPMLARDIGNKEDLIHPKDYIIGKPPSTFNELKAIEYYYSTENLIEKGEYQRTNAVLADALKIFNRYRNRVGVINVLQKLAKLASELRKFNESINYLKQAIEICKTGEVPEDIIIKTQKQLGDTYVNNKQYTEALNQFKIINNFLKSTNPKSYHKDIQIIRLRMAKILTEIGAFKDASLIFKELLKEIQNYPDILAEYYLERGRYFVKKNTISNAIQVLIKASKIENIKPKILAQVLFELAKIYLYDRNVYSKSQEYLLAAEKLIKEKEVSDILFKINIYEALSDAFNKSKNQSEMRFYMEQAQKLRKLLQLRGIY